MTGLPLSRTIATALVIGLTGTVSAGYLLHSELPDLYLCDWQPMTAAQVAAHRGIDPHMLEQLHHNRSLDVSQVCDMPEAKLKRALYRVNNPKPDHPGDWAKQRRMQMQDENGRIPDNALVKAHEQLNAMLAAQQAASPNQDPEVKAINKSNWAWIGPKNIGGRIRSILVHPNSPNTMYIGSVSGGIWKTTNGGTSWKILSDFMANMAVSTMVMDRSNPKIIYAGTGEGFFNGDRIRGAGIFRSLNGGNTWKQLASTKTNDFLFVNRLANSPNNKVILAATETGIFRSTNRGKTWTKVHNIRTLDVNFHPTSSTRAVASGDSGQSWYSTNGGKTWIASTGINASGGFNNRVEIAYAPSKGNIVYASSAFNNGTIYKSTNGGRTFKKVTTSNYAYLGSQGWYDNALWVDPTNANFLIVGGIDLWKSTNGGKTLKKISQWFSAPTASAHADHHAIVSHPNYNGSSNKIVFFGNDGGIYKATNVKTVAKTSGWTNNNGNLGITQFYGAAGHVKSGRITGGTQDNGTLFYKGNKNWSTTFGGDGGFSAAVPGGASPSHFFGEYVYLQIHRSTNGAAASYIFSGISDAGNCALFIAPFILDPNNSKRMLAGGCSLWRSNNVRAGTPAWSKIKTASGGLISAIAVAPGNSKIVWVGYDNGDVYKTSNGTSANPNWTKVDGATLPNRYVTRIAIRKGAPNTVYVTFGGFFDGYTTGNIWRTKNGGSSWANKHGVLPQAPIRSVVMHPKKANVLYVGTEVGIFFSTNSGNTWNVPQAGPTNTSVDELFFLGNTLYAATHGRGVFKNTHTLPPLPPVAVSAAETGGTAPADE